MDHPERIPMNRKDVQETVNRHREIRGLKPFSLRSFGLLVGYARQHKLISEENLEWARLGYLPTPAERKARKRLTA